MKKLVKVQKKVKNSENVQCVEKFTPKKVSGTMLGDNVDEQCSYKFLLSRKVVKKLKTKLKKFKNVSACINNMLIRELRTF